MSLSGSRNHIGASISTTEVVPFPTVPSESSCEVQMGKADSSCDTAALAMTNSVFSEQLSSFNVAVDG